MFSKKNRFLKSLSILEKKVMYDHKVDQKSYKWSGKTKLKKININLLPEYISSNLTMYKKWLD